jgi:glycosyltransferase involved in cell wall biosynthesis
MKPKASLIIPVYNVEKYLEKCLDSAVNQTLQDIEIVIINDGSTDNSLEICKRYAKKDPRINLITQKNGGLSAARNTGIKAATCEYIAFLDSDDYLDPSMMEDTYKKALTENLDIVIFQYNQVDESGNILFTNKVIDCNSQDEFKKRAISARKSPMACDKLYKRSLFTEHDILFPQGLYHEDTYTTYKLVFFAEKIGVLPKAYYYWLRREGSISKSISRKHIEDILNSLIEMKAFLTKEGHFEHYQNDFIRRSYSFSVLMLDRIEVSNYNWYKKLRLEKLVLRKLNILGLSNEKSLQALQKTDPRLHKKYLSKRKNMLRKIANTVLPKGTKRREIVKILLDKNKPTQKENGKNTNKAVTKKKSNMLDVFKGISSDEQKKLQTLKDKFKGERCFIVGNGPSLNKCDLTLLENEYTFAVNGIFYKTEEMGFKPTFYMVEDGHVVDDNLEKINAYDPEYKFFPSLYKEKIIKTENTYFFAADLGFYRKDHYSFEIPRFSRDFSQVSFCGQSVTYLNMQLAFYMGFTEVYLIGMDFSYQIRETDEVQGATLISNEDDINHFHPDYFGKGKKWHDPKVHNVAKNYEFAKKVYEDNGRTIYNATVGGKLKIFERKDYNSLFDSQKKLSIETFQGYMHYYLDSDYIGLLVFDKGELSDHRGIIRKNRISLDKENLHTVIRTSLYTLLNHYLEEKMLLEGKKIQEYKEKLVKSSEDILKDTAKKILDENLLRTTA